jgi:hypothetical protein
MDGDPMPSQESQIKTVKKKKSGKKRKRKRDSSLRTRKASAKSSGAPSLVRESIDVEMDHTSRQSNSSPEKGLQRLRAIAPAGGKKDQHSVTGTDDDRFSVTKERLEMAVEESPCNSTVRATAGLLHLQEAATMLAQLKALKE